MDFDTVLVEHVGQFGRWQRIVFCLVSLTATFIAFTNMGIVFVAASPDHWCRVPALLDSDLTEEQRKNLSLPLETKTNGAEKYSSCQMYDRDYANLSLLSADPSDPVIDCLHGWEYSDTLYSSTIVTQWDLVCDKAWLHATSSSVYMAGLMIGVIVSGSLSDSFGRKKMVFGGMAATGVLQIISAFSPNYYVFIVIRCAIAAFNVASFTCGFVMVVEMVGPRWRLHTGIMIEYFWAFGYMLVAGIAYFVRPWRYLQIVLGVPICAGVLLYWVVPESARWLYTRNRREEADEIMRNMATNNGRTLPADVKVCLQEEARTGHIWDLIRVRSLRARTLNVFFNWFMNSMVYYGLSLSTGDLGGNPYIKFFLFGAVEVPAYILVQLCPVMGLGRRLPVSAAMSFAGTLLLLTIAVPKSMPWLTVLLAMCGKLCISASFALIFVFTAELYPTAVRTVAVGSSSFFASIGGIVAPFIHLLGGLFPQLPVLVYGGGALLAGGLTLLLPETKDKPLVQTLEEMESERTHSHDVQHNSNLSPLLSESKETDSFRSESKTRIVPVECVVNGTTT